MSSERTRIAMSTDEVAAFLAAHRKVQLATINPDGTPHLVTMFYGLRDGRIAFWTYRRSQKARNLARDPRLTCLVEGGDGYFELRGVQVRGTAEPVADVAEVGRLIAATMAEVPADALDGYVAQAAAKRVAYLVRPGRVVSWDHGKLLAT
jgi:PPOX class probable F420-dependent enzyme